MGVDRQRGAIFLVIFRQVGIGLGKLRNFELLGMGEKYCWLYDCIDISLRNIVNFLQFADVSHKFRHVGRACGRVFGQLDII